MAHSLLLQLLIEVDHLHIAAEDSFPLVTFHKSTPTGSVETLEEVTALKASIIQLGTQEELKAASRLENEKLEFVSLKSEELKLTGKCLPVWV